jgi:acyl-CoA synthetase (AMP-forming)/AMP-acid ligase II
VELTHANIMAMAQSMIAFTHMGEDAHSLLILPLFHVNGIVVSVLAPLLAGGQDTVAGRFNPTTFFEIVEQVRPKTFSAVPTIYGEVPVAFVCFRAGACVTPDDLRAHIGRSLAKYKLPAEVIPVEELPKNPVGKIDKPDLRRRITISAN